jgi:glycyl-tRNA synthetase beta chain
LDTLACFWAIDEKPTGSKDPFALRRAALGVTRLVLENDLTLPLRDVISAAHSDADVSDLLSFFHDRLKVYLRDQGIRHDIIDACTAMDGNDDLNLLVKRARALSDALKTDDGENLIQGFKRANNILSQAEAKDGVEYSFGADIKFAEADTEKALFEALDTADVAISVAMKNGDFAAAMSAMAQLRAPIDVFFDDVKINADSEIIRRNRLNLLSRIRTTCGVVADLTRIVG